MSALIGVIIVLMLIFVGTALFVGGAFSLSFLEDLPEKRRRKKLIKEMETKRLKLETKQDREQSIRDLEEENERLDRLIRRSKEEND